SAPQRGIDRLLARVRAEDKAAAGVREYQGDEGDALISEIPGDSGRGEKDGKRPQGRPPRSLEEDRTARAGDERERGVQGGREHDDGPARTVTMISSARKARRTRRIPRVPSRRSLLLDSQRSSWSQFLRTSRATNAWKTAPSDVSPPPEEIVVD